jgi:hypothetical protein
MSWGVAGGVDRGDISTVLDEPFNEVVSASGTRKMHCCPPASLFTASSPVVIAVVVIAMVSFASNGRRVGLQIYTPPFESFLHLPGSGCRGLRFRM